MCNDLAWRAGGGNGDAQGSLAVGAEYERLLRKGILIERANERLCERGGHAGVSV